MENWKKVFRLIGFALLILFASTGLFSGALMLPKTKEKYMNKKTTTEQVDKIRKQKDDD